MLPTVIWNEATGEAGKGSFAGRMPVTIGMLFGSLTTYRTGTEHPRGTVTGNSMSTVKVVLSGPDAGLATNPATAIAAASVLPVESSSGDSSRLTAAKPRNGCLYRELRTRVRWAIRTHRLSPRDTYDLSEPWRQRYVDGPPPSRAVIVVATERPPATERPGMNRSKRLAIALGLNLALVAG